MNPKWGILTLIAAIAFCGESVPMMHAGGAGGVTDKATFAAGCFWGVEAAFRQVKGVIGTTVGYMGGTLKNPTYEDVVAGRAGYREVCEVRYDPTQISYEKLVEVFFKIRNPSFYSPQARGAVRRYNSVIFFHNPEQERIALAVKGQLEATGKFGGPITTAIASASEFWRAEEYHQRYAEKHGLPVCRIEP
jgi:peptide-methionine (S)-S-oxide reductase